MSNHQFCECGRKIVYPTNNKKRSKGKVDDHGLCRQCWQSQMDRMRSNKDYYEENWKE